MSHTVDILLATYNGEPFLEEQLDSILGQTHRDWRIVVRDDGSSDATPEILRRYAARDPGRIRIVKDGRGNLGVKENFSTLLRLAEAPYAMTCDQDDVWLPEKIAACLAKARELESRFGQDMPVLAHCDLRVVDRDLREIHPSYRRYQHIDPNNSRRLRRALLQNPAIGCGNLFNRRLAELSAPVPPDARGHDWWLSLIAAARGRIGHVNGALALYRQHGENDNGAKNWSLPAVARKLLTDGPGMVRRNRSILRGSQRQAGALLALHGEFMSAEDRQVVARYASIAERDPLSRRVDLIRNGIFFDGYLKNAGLFALI